MANNVCDIIWHCFVKDFFSHLVIIFFLNMCIFKLLYIIYFIISSNFDTSYFYNIFILILEVVKNDEDAIEHGKIIF